MASIAPHAADVTAEGPAASQGLFDVAQAIATDHALARGLAGYLRAVARTAGVGVEGATSEVSDTATAYLALEQRSSAIPNRDLMLAWSERDGWRIAVETDPDETPIVLAYLGDDVLPTPHAVAQFVIDLLAHPQARRPHLPPMPTRRNLSARLSRYRTQSPTL